MGDVLFPSTRGITNRKPGGASKRVGRPRLIPHRSQRQRRERPQPASPQVKGRVKEVREGGVEPPHPFGHTDLNRARLPIPPLARARQR